MGVGMIVAVSAEEADKALRVLKENGEDAVILGQVIDGDEGVVFK
jgi:phosphoribosylformylglycinamidine cyclo-ligase